MARATSSLPAPDSPEIKTRPSVGATTVICLRKARIPTDSPTISYSAFNSADISSLTRSSCLCRKALRTVSTVFSIESGFSIKSNAPSFVARTAVFCHPNQSKKAVAALASPPSSQPLRQKEKGRGKEASNNSFDLQNRFPDTCPPERTARITSLKVHSTSLERASPAGGQDVRD